MSTSSWQWCICPYATNFKDKCAGCSERVGFGYELSLHYQGRHWHVSCLLDKLTSGTPTADNPQVELAYGPLAGLYP